MKKLLLWVVALMSISVCQAQDFRKSGKTIDRLVPETWERDTVMGDLNKDGILDLVVAARYNDVEIVESDEDEEDMVSDTLHFVIRKLAIYFGEKDGSYTLVKKSDDVLPDDTDTEYHEISMSINAKGALILGYSEWRSMGSSTTGNVSTTFRYQDGDFYEIGYDAYEFSRMTGEGERVSINYLTHKKVIEPFNEFEDPEGKTYKKRTEKIAAEPLRVME